MYSMNLILRYLGQEFCLAYCVTFQFVLYSFSLQFWFVLLVIWVFVVAAAVLFYFNRFSLSVSFCSEFFVYFYFIIYDFHHYRSLTAHVSVVFFLSFFINIRRCGSCVGPSCFGNIKTVF